MQITHSSMDTAIAINNQHLDRSLLSLRMHILTRMGMGLSMGCTTAPYHQEEKPHDEWKEATPLPPFSVCLIMGAPLVLILRGHFCFSSLYLNPF
jgi:hypothetical protein